MSDKKRKQSLYHEIKVPFVKRAFRIPIERDRELTDAIIKLLKKHRDEIREEKRKLNQQ